MTLWRSFVNCYARATDSDRRSTRWNRFNGSNRIYWTQGTTW